MHTGTPHIFVPGQAPAPADVACAMMRARHVLGTSGFADLLDSVRRDLRALCGTRDAQIALVPGSASTAWEAVLTNTLSPGDRVLIVRHGQFSGQLVRLAQDLGARVEVIDQPWGAPAPAQQIGRVLGADRYGTIKAVCVLETESASGARSDIAAIRAEIDTSFHDALLFVDVVPTLGAAPVQMDACGIDALIASSRGGLMCPAGLGLLALGPRALAACDGATMRRATLDLHAILTAHDAGGFCSTPPTGQLQGLRAGLDLILAEGTSAAHARHTRCARALRAGIGAMGLRLLAPHHPADTLTTVLMPPDIDAHRVTRIARDMLNAQFCAGLGPMAGRCIRIGHAGAVDDATVLTALGLLDLALHQAGARLALGAGLAAAQPRLARPVPRPAFTLAAE